MVGTFKENITVWLYKNEKVKLKIGIWIVNLSQTVEGLNGRWPLIVDG